MASRSTLAVQIEPAPLHAILIPLGAAFLIGALVTDLLYLATFSTQWETFSIWLITAGLLIAAVAALALVVDLVSRRTARLSWWRFAIFAAAVIVSIVNAFVHSRDGYTAVAPSGVWLSAIVTALLVIGGWGGWSLNARSYEARR